VFVIVPVLKPVPFIESAVHSALAKILSKPQLANFIWLLSALILGQQFNLSYIEAILLESKSDNAFPWFLSHSKLNPDRIWQALLSLCCQYI
jgi:hypothetical protein